MKRFKLAKVLVVAMFAIFAVAALASAAMAETLPEFTVQTNATGTGGKANLYLTGAGIACASSTSTGTAATKKTGTLAIKFSGCKLGGEECHSKGDAAEVILMSSHYEGAKGLGGQALLLLTVEPSPLIIECKFAATVVEIKGSVLGNGTPVKTDTTAYKLAVVAAAAEPHAQEFTDYVNDAGTAVTVKLEGSVNKGAFKTATFNSETNAFTTAALTEVIFK